MDSLQDITSVIRAVVTEELRGDTRVVDVLVSEDIDHLGDAVLRVNVVYDEKAGLPKAAHTVGLIRLIRDALEREFGESRFPLLSLTSREDMEAEAA